MMTTTPGPAADPGRRLELEQQDRDHARHRQEQLEEQHECPR